MANSNDVIKNGDLVKDKISGFEGVVCVTMKWLHGCVRYGVQPMELDKDGTPHDIHYFDEPQIELLEAGAYTEEPGRMEIQFVPEPGGPRPDPKRY